MNRRGRVQLDLREIPELQKIVLPNVRPTGRELGRGAFGTVEEVEIPGATCAAKRIHESLLRLGNVGDAKNITDAFVRECLLMSTLHHPHIVQFLGVCFLPGSQLPLLVMEQLTMSLDDLLEISSHVLLATKRSILNDIVNGLTYLHSHTPPIIHRDLTAKNVLLNSAMVAKLADLGVARIVNIQPDQLATTMTQAPGTLVYMPPEALEPNAKYNAKLDIFSFGVLGLYTLTQIFPVLKAPTYIDSDGKIAARSEIDRRIDYIEQIHQEFGHHHPLVLMIKQCLHDDPRWRPTLDKVLQWLNEAKVKTDCHYEQMSCPEMEQALTDMEQALREKEQAVIDKEEALRQKEEVLREKEEEIAQLQQQLSTSNHKTSTIMKKRTKKLYKTREDFSSNLDYGRYVKANLQVGMYVRAIADYESVSEGDLGIYKQSNDGTPPAQFAWDGLGGETYWVYWYQVVILPNRYRNRDEFSSDQDFGRYIKANLQVGMQVKARVSYESLTEGDIGTYKQTNNGYPPALFAWNGLGKTYWVYWHQVEILPNPYKTRDKFSSDTDYGQYVKAVIRVGMHVRARVDYESVSVGDHGIYKQSNNGYPPAQFAWDGLGGKTYWLYWHQVDLISPALDDGDV